MRLNLSEQAKINQLDNNKIPNAKGVLYAKNSDNTSLFFKDFNKNEINLTKVTLDIKDNNLDIGSTNVLDFNQNLTASISNGVATINVTGITQNWTVISDKNYKTNGSSLSYDTNSQFNLLFGENNSINNGRYNIVGGNSNTLGDSDFGSMLGSKLSEIDNSTGSQILQSDSAFITNLSSYSSIISSSAVTIDNGKFTTVLGVNENNVFSQDYTTFATFLNLRPTNTQPASPEVGTIIYYSGSTTEELQVYKSSGWTTIV